MAKPTFTPARVRRRPISGPALLVLAIVLAGIWFGSRALSQTATVSVDTDSRGQQSDVGSTQLSTAHETPGSNVETQPSATPPSSDQQRSEPSAPSSDTRPPSSGLPAGYPTDIPAPSGGTLTKATAAGQAGDRSFVASYRLTGAPSAVSEIYQQQLKAAGFSVHAVLGSSNSAFFGAEKESRSISVSVGADGSASDVSNLTITTGE